MKELMNEIEKFNKERSMRKISRCIYILHSNGYETKCRF